MNANETCEDSIHGPYEPDDVADHCGGCGMPLCEEHARKCPCCGRVNCTDCGEICEACWRLVCREHAKWNPEYAQYECPTCYDRWDCGKGREDIDVIGEHYLHLAREWGWNDTEVRDAMYVETKQRGWCRE